MGPLSAPVTVSVCRPQCPESKGNCQGHPGRQRQLAANSGLSSSRKLSALSRVHPGPLGFSSSPCLSVHPSPCLLPSTLLHSPLFPLPTPSRSAPHTLGPHLSPSLSSPTPPLCLPLLLILPNPLSLFPDPISPSASLSPAPPPPPSLPPSARLPIHPSAFFPQHLPVQKSHIEIQAIATPLPQALGTPLPPLARFAPSPE